MSDPQGGAGDRLAVGEVAQGERYARDMGDWGAMSAMYHPDSLVRVVWFHGTGPEFVDASKRRFDLDQKSVHLVGNSHVEVEGDRALSDTGCTVNVRRMLDGVLCDMCCFCRLRSKVERIDGRWVLRSLIGLYQRDMISLVYPWDKLSCDVKELERQRSSYAWFSYSNLRSGGAPDQTLPGLDRMDLVDELLTEERHWLRHGN